MRPVSQISIRATAPSSLDLTAETLRALIAGDAAAPVREYFRNYPEKSYMSDRCRVILYELIRALNAKKVAEIGTFFAGTAEMICRALYDNGGGTLYTTDPFGGEVCPPIIAEWPPELRELCEFSPINSMEFFLSLEQRGLTLDLCLVDGNHDFEFALFDLNMAAKLVRPGGIIIMDNAEQTGPFYATREFLVHNEGWKELGYALAQFSPSRPFDKDRASIANTTFLILQKPRHFLVQATPASTTQKEIPESEISGLRFTLADQEHATGKLHVQVILRAFIDTPREIEEYFQICEIPIDTAATNPVVEFRFDEPLVSSLQQKKGGCKHTLELEFSWEPFSGPNLLRLVKTPAPISGSR